MSESQTQTATPPVEEAKTDGKPDEVLAVLNETLKRDFKTREEALKSVDNLKNMVGDNAIAELREKAKDAELFAKVVQKYAKEEGLSNDEARKTLLEIAMETSPTQERAQEPSKQSATEARLDAALVRLQEKELLETNPEAKMVMNDLKSLRTLHPGKELREIYEASSLKQAATAAAEYEKEKAAKATTAVEPNARQANMEDANLKTLAAQAHKSGMVQDKVALVDAFFKAQAK